MVKKKTVHEKVIREVIEKPVKKKTARKRAPRKPAVPKIYSAPVVPASSGIDRTLVESFISMQKVLMMMAAKFDGLSTQISKLLELFEISAKALAEKGYSIEDKKAAEKLDNLLEQNKIIAKGIALLHEKESEQIPQQVQQMQRPVMQPVRQTPQPVQQQPQRIKEAGA